MEWDITEEQRSLRGVVREFLRVHSGETEVRRLMDSARGYDTKVWGRLAELGLLGLAVPEKLSGSGAGLREVGIVLEEMGRVLMCGPYLSTVLAVEVLLASGDVAAQDRLLPMMAGGSVLATVAHREHSAGHVAASPTVARPVDGGWLLSGDKRFVLDGHVADVFIVSARIGRADGATGLFLVEAGTDGVQAQSLETLDRTRRQARVQLGEVPGVPLGAVADAEVVLARLALVEVALAAAEQIGVAERALEMAVDYAGARVQFGRPIGSFQAIKHKCADMLICVESIRAVGEYAAWAAAHARDELPLAAATAGAYSSDACFFVTSENVQVHGGIGFTWEHPANLYFKRAKSLQVMFGAPHVHRAEVARLLQLPADR